LVKNAKSTRRSLHRDRLPRFAIAAAAPSGGCSIAFSPHWEIASAGKTPPPLPTVLIRLSKIILSAAIGLYLLIVALDNVTD